MWWFHQPWDCEEVHRACQSPLRDLVFADDDRQCQRDTFLLSQLGAEKISFLEKSQSLSETIREEREGESGEGGRERESALLLYSICFIFPFKPLQALYSMVGTLNNFFFRVLFNDDFNWVCNQDFVSGYIWALITLEPYGIYLQSFVIHIWVTHGLPLWGLWGRRSLAGN